MNTLFWILRCGWVLGSLLPGGACGSLPATGLSAEDSSKPALPEAGIHRDALMRHVEYLASADMKGRAMGSAEEKLTAEYIARELTQAGLKPPAGWASPIQEFQTGALTAHNVVFALPGADAKLADEWLVIGAHLDHLGVHDGQVYHGADDNASGVAGVIEVAKVFKKAQPAPARSILFCFFTGEERGFVGSRHFIQNPPVPKERIVAMICADMIGRCDTPTIHGTGNQTCAAFGELVELAAKRVGIEMKFDHPEWTYQSDHYVFFAEKIPFIYFGVEDHPDYHRPTDTADKINREEIERVSRLIYVAAEALARLPERPAWRDAAAK
ncbi:MAG: M20/M25/M40 family metallo-hydrolase [Phycisphaerales bacterium]|nr:M20/M25/M40 family metallo-hydrolase [Phycisphaerales bacterium]